MILLFLLSLPVLPHTVGDERTRLMHFSVTLDNYSVSFGDITIVQYISYYGTKLPGGPKTTGSSVKLV
jgi:hypothetical protein